MQVQSVAMLQDSAWQLISSARLIFTTTSKELDEFFIGTRSVSRSTESVTHESSGCETAPNLLNFRLPRSHLICRVCFQTNSHLTTEGLRKPLANVYEIKGNKQQDCNCSTAGLEDKKYPFRVIFWNALLLQFHTMPNDIYLSMWLLY